MDDPLEHVKNFYTWFKYVSFLLLLITFFSLYYLDSKIADCEHPRRLTGKQKQILRSRLRSKNRPLLVVSAVAEQGKEPHWYASELAEFFHDEAGWNAGLLGSVPDETLSGLAVVVEAGNNDASTLGLQLVAGLQAAGISVSFRQVDLPTLRKATAGSAALHLWVGHKFSRPLGLLDLIRGGSCRVA